MQADCSEKKPTGWAQTASEKSVWKLQGADETWFRGFDISKTTSTDVTMWLSPDTDNPDASQAVCSNIHHTEPPTCSFSCERSWTFKLVGASHVLCRNRGIHQDEASPSGRPSFFPRNRPLIPQFTNDMMSQLTDCSIGGL